MCLVLETNIMSQKQKKTKQKLRKNSPISILHLCTPITINYRAKHKIIKHIYHTKECVLTHPFSFNYHLVLFEQIIFKIFVVTCKMCSMTTLLIPPLNIYPPPVLGSSTKNLNFIIPSFTNSKQRLYWPPRHPSIFIKFLPSLILRCKRFAMYFSIRLK